jgi:N-acetylglutamate synthase-like GNAT family acetyltransferase
MARTTRVLSDEEWRRFEGTDMAPALAGFEPEQTRIIVVEDEGKIVGRWVVTRWVHVECVKIEPNAMNRGNIALRLVRAMHHEARQLGAKAVITGAPDETVRDLLARLGAVPMPCDEYILPLGRD